MPKPSSDLPAGFLTLGQAAKRLGLATNTVREHVGAGRLRAVKWRGVWWTTEEHVAEFRVLRRPPGRPKASAADEE